MTFLNFRRIAFSRKCQGPRDLSGIAVDKIGRNRGNQAAFLLYNADQQEDNVAVVYYSLISTNGAPTTWSSGTSIGGDVATAFTSLVMSSLSNLPSDGFKASTQVPTATITINPIPTATFPLSSPSPRSREVSNTQSVTSVSTSSDMSTTGPFATQSSFTSFSAPLSSVFPTLISSVESLASNTLSTSDDLFGSIGTVTQTANQTVIQTAIQTATRTAIATLSGSPPTASSGSRLGRDVGISAGVFVALLVILIAASVFIQKRHRRQRSLSRASRNSANFPFKPELDVKNKINEKDAKDTCFRGNELPANEVHLVELSASYMFDGRELPATPIFKDQYTSANSVIQD
ncbi:MAG: hypothetical protein MMC33_001584 [Icmadophila ericetorum]|nr:hypothetical protein [Icmadophila ericetorum]